MQQLPESDEEPARAWEPQGETDCRVRTIMDRVGDKWSLAVVSELSAGPRRFSEVRRAVPGINQRMLTSTLRTLERDGLVSRTVYAQIPPRVDYELTGLGRTLLATVSSLIAWAASNADDIDEARRRYDARTRPQSQL
ncbi:HxlR family transcriptional regulator [Parafrankia colletiae]|uniref:HxlR family transcriptional regulator n=2 Tax=Parafrankia colletiae TaxID=573497 RepID=A0A1S1QAJ9_9ACTN|nr:HxlR family transcriptional regulator [Parafrankia colletiae]